MVAGTSGQSSPISMHINEVAPIGGSGNGPAEPAGDLSVHDDELGKLGNLAYELYQRLSADGDHAKRASTSAASSLTGDGMDTGSALVELNGAWETKLSTLMEACAHISNHLDMSRKAHGQDEETIKTSMKNAEGKRMTVSRIYDFIN